MAGPGEPVVEATSGYSGPHYRAVVALKLCGVQAPWLLHGSMNGPAFETYVALVLAPSLRRGDTVLLDNLAPHKHAFVQQWLERRGARVEFLPPYSPDLNPIEQCWSKVKTALRAAKARTFDVLVTARAQALRAVTVADIAAWFAHCG